MDPLCSPEPSWGADRERQALGGRRNEKRRHLVIRAKGSADKDMEAFPSI